MVAHTRESTLTQEERAAYDAWTAKDPYHRYGSHLLTAYIAGRRDLATELAPAVTDPPVDPALKNAWESLSTEEQLVELRAGEWSPFYPAFKADPTVWGDCDEHGRVAVMAEGVCDCGRLVHEARALT